MILSESVVFGTVICVSLYMFREQMKYLGLIVSHTFSWSQHIQATCKRAGKCLALYVTNFVPIGLMFSIILK